MPDRPIATIMNLPPGSGAHGYYRHHKDRLGRLLDYDTTSTLDMSDFIETRVPLFIDMGGFEDHLGDILYRLYRSGYKVMNLEKAMSSAEHYKAFLKGDVDLDKVFKEVEHPVPKGLEFLEMVGDNVIDLGDYATNPEAKNQPAPTSDLEALNNPKCWPYRPMCPIKKYEEEFAPPLCAVVLEDEPGRIYHILCPALCGMNDSQAKEALGEAKTTEYGSWEKMLEDGWRGD